jgi:DNA-directed RNA polymerase II subunit RPB11
MLFFFSSPRQLLLTPYVLFAGYKVGHPLEPKFIIKVQTDPDHTPIQAIQDACKNLILTLSKMREAFTRDLNTYRALQPEEGVMEGMDGRGALDLGV